MGGFVKDGGWLGWDELLGILDDNGFWAFPDLDDGSWAFPDLDDGSWAFPDLVESSGSELQENPIGAPFNARESQKSQVLGHSRLASESLQRTSL